jgi:WD40 repeat protein
MTAVPARFVGARALSAVAVVMAFAVAVLTVPTAATAVVSSTAATGANEADQVAYSPDGTQLAVGARDSRVFVYRPDTGALLRTLPGHSGQPVTAVAFSPDGKLLATGGRDSTVRLWDAATGTQVKVLTGHEQAVRALAFSADGATLVTGGEDSRAFVWDVATGRIRQVLTGNGDFVTAVGASPDGTSIATATRQGRIRIWDAAKGSVRRLLLGHASEVTSLAFAPDGTTLASGSSDTTVRLWTLSTGAVARTLKGHTAAVESVSFGRGGAALASGSADGTVGLWDAGTGALKARLGSGGAPVQSVAFNPSGRSLAEGRKDALVRTWDSSDYRAMLSWSLPTSSTTTSPATPKSSAKKSQRLSSDSATAPLTASATTAGAAATAASTDGPGGPILVVTDAADPFSTYYAEILRAEGLNSFATADVGSLAAGDLAAYDVVVLAARSLTAGQAAFFSDWVTAGGNLVAMRPDAQLAGLLGITPVGGTLADAYLKVDTSRAPGTGIVGDTVQYHGTADRYSLSGARAVATLYSDASTATSSPAVTLRDVGVSGGQAAAFTYDLARSVVYTRQGNPGWSGQERDGASPIRSDDLYFGAAAGDPRPDWVDLGKVAIPQADEQQRLLTNLILAITEDRKPLPRLWFLPRGEKAAVVMTGDDHGNNGTAGRFDQFLAASPAGCSVADWECIRGTSYIYPSTPLTNSQAAAYASQGFEIGLHLSTNCSDWTPSSLRADYTNQLAAFTSKYTGIPAPTTNRTHCIAWSDWSTQATVERENGMRLDTNYYYWPPSWNQNRPGFFTGSGLPMRFADTTGTAIDVYQAASQLTDESGQSYPYTVDTLLDRAIGPEEYYGVFTINAHTDVAQITESTTTMTSAQARSVPVVSAQQMLTWLDGRNASSVQNISWSAGQLSFTAPPAAGANGLEVMVPGTSTAGTLRSVTLDGAPVTVTTRTVKGVAYGFVRAAAGTFVATYQPDTTAPTVTATSPPNGATGVSATTAVTATFDEDLDAGTVNTDTVQLKDPRDAVVPASVTYNTATRSARLTPTTSLAASTAYRVTVKGGSGDPAVKDVSGNRLAADAAWTFTTASGPVCPCSIWPSSATPVNQAENDPNAVELGVRFRSDVSGYVTGVRFWKGSANNGTHTGNLWSNTGTRLATATFSNESSSGWQQVDFSTPVAVTAGTTYVASYHTTSGNYAGDNGAFAGAGVDNAPLHALRDGQDGASGVYRYGASGFPSDTYRSSNYWVDVVFSTTLAADTTAPTVVTTSPTNGATGVAAGTAVKAVFSEPVDPATITGSTMGLTGPAGPVPASVTYDAGTRTATLTPSGPLAGSTTFTATVKGGSTDPRVKDVAGNALAADRTWTFSTAAPPPPVTAPTGLAATAGPSGVALDWADNPETGLSGYAVYRAAASTGPFTRITAAPVTASAWEDSLAPAGTSYYRVTALGGTESAPSAVVDAAMAKANRIVNPGFEVDANADGRPDSWTSSARFTRTTGSARSETYGGRHSATTNAGYTIGQTGTGLTAGTVYDFAGWVNVPATTDAFTFRFDIVWRNSSNTVVSTQTVRTLSGPTSGWVKLSGSYAAPAGTTRASVNMVLTSLNATVGVDDVSFR